MNTAVSARRGVQLEAWVFNSGPLRRRRLGMCSYTQKSMSQAHEDGENGPSLLTCPRVRKRSLHRIGEEANSCNGGILTDIIPAKEVTEALREATPSREITIKYDGVGDGRTLPSVAVGAPPRVQDL